MIYLKCKSCGHSNPLNPEKFDKNEGKWKCEKCGYEHDWNWKIGDIEVGFN